MTDITFQYFGRELIEPLRYLMEKQRMDIARLHAELEKLPTADRESARSTPTLIGIGKPPTSGELKARQLIEQITDLQVGHRESQLWHYECQRRPSASWNLSLADLGKIYHGRNLEELPTEQDYRFKQG
jgi:hypothetical protein